MAENTSVTKDWRREQDNVQDRVQKLDCRMYHFQKQQALILEEMRKISGEIGNPSENSKAGGNNLYHTSTCCPRFDFPCFAGEDVKDWLYKCDKFFEINETPILERVQLASIHLEGEALHWHQRYVQQRGMRGLPLWIEYVIDITARFEDPLADLKKLKQLGSVREYRDKFVALLNRVELNDEYAVHCFLNGLKQEVKSRIYMFQPCSLKNTFCWAKMQEDSLAFKPSRINKQLMECELPEFVISDQCLEAEVETKTDHLKISDLTVKKAVDPVFDEIHILGDRIGAIRFSHQVLEASGETVHDMVEVTPRSIVHHVKNLGPEYAAAEITYTPLLAYVAATGTKEKADNVKFAQIDASCSVLRTGLGDYFPGRKKRLQRRYKGDSCARVKMKLKRFGERKQMSPSGNLKVFVFGLPQQLAQDLEMSSPGCTFQAVVVLETFESVLTD